MSGASSIPPTGFDSSLRISFQDVSSVPTANVCGLTLYLPIQHETYETFEGAMLLGILGHDGYGSV